MFWFIGLYTANQYIMSCLVRMCTLLVGVLPISNDSNKRIYQYSLELYKSTRNHILIYINTRIILKVGVMNALFTYVLLRLTYSNGSNTTILTNCIKYIIHINSTQVRSYLVYRRKCPTNYRSLKPYVPPAISFYRRVGKKCSTCSNTGAVVPYYR